MKNKFSAYGLSFLFFLCAGCAEKNEPVDSDLPIVIAAKRSVTYAKNDRVDLAQYTVRSVTVFSNAQTRVIDRKSSDQYDIDVLRKLYNQRYWEVCYGHVSLDVAGAMYCYYLDKSKYELLASYRMK
jgi:hypothetical protein